MSQSSPPEKAPPAKAPTPPLVARVLGSRVRRWLGTARAQLWIVFASVLLCAPALSIGLVLDDRGQQLGVIGDPTGVYPHAPLDLFAFFDGSEQRYREGVEHGYLPWFTEPDLKLSFMRPLTALTHWFDYGLLGDATWLMHLHSLLWALLLGLAARRLIGSIEHGWVVGLTLALYVLDAGHGMPAGWLASRNQLIVGVFGALALTAHIRWCKDGRSSLPLSVWLFVALGLLSGEAMVGWFGFFVAYALVLDPAGWKRGVIALWPLGLLVVVWRGVYAQLGYGTANSGLYVDPTSSPLRFVFAAVERLPQLLAGQLGGPPTGLGAVIGETADRIFIVLAASLLLVVIAMFWRLLRNDPLARFWALGAVLAAIPSCATNPSSRLMVVAGLGTAGFVARVIAAVIEGHSAPQPPVAEASGASVRSASNTTVRLSAPYQRVVAAFWLILLIAPAPIRLPMESRAITTLGKPSQLAASGITVEDPEQTLIVLAIPEPVFMCSQFKLIRRANGQPVPHKLRCLAALEGAGKLTRVDEQTFDLRVDAGMFDAFFVSLLRHPERPFPAPWQLTLSDLSLSVVERAPDGEPLTLRVQLLNPPASYRFVIWSSELDRLVDFPLPAPGQSVAIQGEPFIDLAM